MLQFLTILLITYLSTKLSLKIFPTESGIYSEFDTIILSLLWTIVIVCR
jgi:hypothetical protein